MLPRIRQESYLSNCPNFPSHFYPRQPGRHITQLQDRGEGVGERLWPRAMPAGWPRGPDGKPMPPEGAVLQEIGPIVAPPSLDADGTPVPGDVLDPRYHVNAAWHGV